jgi:hypothetical protein
MWGSFTSFVKAPFFPIPDFDRLFQQNQQQLTPFLELSKVLPHQGWRGSIDRPSSIDPNLSFRITS